MTESCSWKPHFNLLAPFFTLACCPGSSTAEREGVVLALGSESTGWAMGLSSLKDQNRNVPKGTVFWFRQIYGFLKARKGYIIYYLRYKCLPEILHTQMVPQPKFLNLFFRQNTIYERCPCLNSTSLPSPGPGHSQPGTSCTCVCVGLRGFICQQSFSGEYPKMWVNKGQAKNKHFTVFFWIHFSGKSTYNKKVFVQLLPCQRGVTESSFEQLFLLF